MRENRKALEGRKVPLQCAGSERNRKVSRDARRRRLSLKQAMV